MNRKICIAPMLDWTDRHYRYLIRQISQQCTLYTEMINVNAILHGNRDSFLEHDNLESPITIQLGGSMPADLAKCAKIAQDYGYNEVNLNVGCPSDRVQKGAFGLVLMANPKLVANCITAMKEACSIPVSIKCRIGYDHNDSYPELYNFISHCQQAEVDFICIHARKGWLRGLSPKENRTIPKLKYATVYKTKQDFPDLVIGINGGITTIAESIEHLKKVDSVMIGREAYHNPLMLVDIDEKIYLQKETILNGIDIVNAMLPYIDNELHKGTKLHHITRHMLGLFQGEPGARAFRRHLSENSTKPKADAGILLEALTYIKQSK